MALNELAFKKIYRSIYDDIDRDFLMPALLRSTTYDRGTGYFSLRSLSGLTNGLVPFIRNGGNIRVVTSVDLSLEDRALICNGLEIQKHSIIQKLNEDILEQLSDPVDAIKMDVITNLIAANRLVVKVAYMPRGGIYHEKVGILKDSIGNRVCFIGSQNETYSGHKRNIESIVVLDSWTDGVEDISQEEKYFEQLWQNKIEGIEVFTLPEAIKCELFNKFRASDELDESIKTLEESYTLSRLDSSDQKMLYDYQERAINEFLENGYQHFYEMATGTGKTYTSVKTVEKLHEIVKKLSVLVLAPRIDLQPQWEAAFREIGVEPLLFGGIANLKTTEENFDKFIIKSHTSDKINVGISIYDTFFGKQIHNLGGLAKDSMIIIDEAHNLSPHQIKNIPKQFPYRLGLSATPERFSLNETENIIKYFLGDRTETYKYTIDEAIANNFLAHYNYYPLYVYFNDEEFENYQKFTKQLMFLENEESPDEEKIIEVRIKRSSIVKKSNGKLIKLKKLVKNKKHVFQNSVLYCGQGKDNEAEESIIDAVTKILAKEGRYKVSQYTSKTDDRIRVLSEFERGYFDTLIAIKCFDEGVDVPKLDKIYIMASDTLNRQTIQRRGRVLRKCKESGKTVASIYDFIVLPPQGSSNEIGARSIVKNELRRATEYTRLSDNKEKIMNKLNLIKSYYGIVEDENGDEREYEEVVC